MTTTQNKALFGTDLFGDEITRPSRGKLADRFEFPPFSVLNAQTGAWQDRKRAWLAMGIKSELGRNCEVFAIGDKDKWNEKHMPGGRARPACTYGEHKQRDGRANTSSSLNAMKIAGGFDAASGIQNAGTSIFDPVLCELCYRWFCPTGGQIVDPFAGGSVRGIVAGMLGFKYWGGDLRQGQIDANEAQRTAIVPDAPITWVCGDSMETLSSAPEADFIFSCPPYGDLEVYSDDPRDISNMEYHTFLAAYKRIILRAIGRLKNNRMACFVVGDFRDKKTGMYRGFVADTINAFREIGMPLYNDGILITAVGSLPVRIASQFDKSRKLGKTHQNILVFSKGDARKAFSGDAQ